MMIKFLKHGTGDPGRAAAYLISSKDHLGRIRAGVKTLRGDTATFVTLARSSLHVHNYSSGLIAWAKEDAPTDLQIDEVLDEFEAHAFAGLKKNQYHMTAVLHVSADGSKHVHVLIPRIEVTSAKALNIAPPGHLKYYDSLRDYFNHYYGWARPDDPSRARPLLLPHHIQKQNAVYESLNTGVPRKKHRLELIDGYVQRKILTAEINNRTTLIQALSLIGEITRCSENYITIKTTSGTDRLTGGLYADILRKKASTTRTKTRNSDNEISEHTGRIDETRSELLRKCYADLHARRAKRSAYNLKNYPDRSVIGNSPEQDLSETERSRTTEHTTPVEIRRLQSSFDEGISKNDRNSVRDIEGQARQEIKGAEEGEAELQVGENQKQNNPPQSKQPEHLKDILNDHPILQYLVKYKNKQQPKVAHHNHYKPFNIEESENERTTQFIPRANLAIENREFADQQKFKKPTRIRENTMLYSEFFRKISEQADRVQQFIESRTRDEKPDDRQAEISTRKNSSPSGYTAFDQRDGATFVERIKQFFSKFRTERNSSGRGNETTSTISVSDASIVKNRLEQLATYRERSRSELRAVDETIKFFDNRIREITQRIQAVSDVLHRYKLPKNTFESRLKELFKVNNQFYVMGGILKSAKEADFIIRCHYEELRKPYWQRKEELIRSDYFYEVKNMFNEIKPKIEYLKKEEYVHLYEIADLAEHYINVIGHLYKDENVKRMAKNLNQNDISTITAAFKSLLADAEQRHYPDISILKSDNKVIAIERKEATLEQPKNEDNDPGYSI